VLQLVLFALHCKLGMFCLTCVLQVQFPKAAAILRLTHLLLLLGDSLHTYPPGAYCVADTVGDLGYAQELGNYGEYSGAPNTAETYSYAKTVLECVTANPDGRGRALLIGGGIANFTGAWC
jgi:hypothetical protein